MKNKIVITIIVAIFMVAMIILANKNNASDGLERSTSADNVISQAESSIEEENGQLDSTESEYKDNAETKEEAFYESENNNSMVDNDANTNNENYKVVEEETVDEGEGKRHELPIG